MKRNAKRKKFSEMSLHELVSYLSDEHYPYLVHSFSEITPCIQTIGNADTEKADAVVLKELLHRIVTLLQEYFHYEKDRFFPGTDVINGHQRTAYFSELLYESRQYHKGITNTFEEINAISEQYTSPEHTSAMVKLCYAQLFNFEQDVLTYILLKEDFLFPKLLRANKE